MFMTIRLFASACGLALCLSACASTGGLSPNVQNDIATTLAVTCPIIAAAGGQIGSNAKLQAAYSLLVDVCPPNPPPLNPVVAAVDILNAYQVLKSVMR
jgi:hypothetical protein